MSHVINSRALTGKKPCINKAIYALFMHGYAIFNMIVPGPQICCHYENEYSLWKLRSQDIDEKAKQNSARNKAKYSKCFQFLCNNGDQTCFFNALTFARSLGRCWKTWPSASVFNTSQGTWWMLMHEKPCLIAIMSYAKQNGAFSYVSSMQSQARIYTTRSRSWDYACRMYGLWLCMQNAEMVIILWNAQTSTTCMHSEWIDSNYTCRMHVFQLCLQIAETLVMHAKCTYSSYACKMHRLQLCMYNAQTPIMHAECTDQLCMQNAQTRYASRMHRLKLCKQTSVMHSECSGDSDYTWRMHLFYVQNAEASYACRTHHYTCRM